MNTPKLTNLHHGVLPRSDNLRIGQASDPLNGLNFSQLLGDVSTQQRNTGGASEAPRHSGSRAQSSSSAPPSSSSASNADRAQNDRQTAPARSDTQSSPAKQNEASRRQETAAAPRTNAGNNAATPDSTPPPGSPAANRPDTRPVDTAEAAEAVAEAGATGAPVVPSLAALPIPALTTGALNITGAPVQPPLNAEGAILSPAGQAPQLAGLEPVLQTPAIVTSSEAQGINLPSPSAAPAPISAATGMPLQGFAEVTTPMGNVEATLSAPGTATQPAHPAGAHTAIIPDTLAAATANQSTYPVMGQPLGFAVAQAPAATPDIALTPDTAAKTVFVNADTLYPVTAEVAGMAGQAGTAAARSLQDFTSMMVAARATSSASPLSHSIAATGLEGSPLMAPGTPGSFIARLPGAAIPAALGSPQWPTEFGRQFINIAQAANGVGHIAELRLDPPDLGPLRITLTISDNIAHAVISSPHAIVRQTVENALPQLQQMLEQSGLSLGQTSVNDQSAQQQSGNDASGNARGGATENGTRQATGPETVERTRPADPSALVDTFA